VAADTYDSILGLILQGTGNNNNNWGAVANSSMISPAARAIAGVKTITATSGTVDLSGTVPPAGLRQDVDHIQLLNGALTGDVTVILPNVSKTWWFRNSTTNAFNVYIKVPGGVSPSGLKQIPQSTHVMIMCDGNGNLYRSDGAEVGSLRISAYPTIGGGALACNGASLLRSAYPDLYNAIGTTWGSVDGTHFTLPNFTDTGRFLRSSSGSLAVGTYQANQNAAHTHTGSGTTSTENADHTHTYSGTTGSMNQNASHSHSSNAITGSTTTGGGGFSAGNNGSATINAANTDHQHAYSGTTSGKSGTHSHTYSFTTSGGSADGTEARPESAVVLFGIRY